MANSKGTAAWAKEHREFWEKLYAYNQEQPLDKRILVVPIDIEWQVGLALEYLGSLPGANRLAKLQERPHTWEQFRSLLNEIQQDREASPGAYARALGEEGLFHLDRTLSNLTTRLAVADNPEEAMDIRELAMYENFLMLYEHLPQGKYFGQLGMAHVYQGRTEGDMQGATRLAMYLCQEESPVHGRVISIAYFYYKSKMASWQNNYVEMYVPSSFPDSVILTRFMGEDLTLFKLNGEDSPYSREALLVNGLDGGVTLDYFQYVLGIKNSPAITPYGPLD